ncbi:MAG TPA: hypothetical protein VFL80_05875, partial [Thermoanaerobaculia bacterium]|nr:hypothetical protein [Thermoanaerobaculia bacterium]
YVFGFRPIYPGELPAQVRSLVEVVPHWTAMMRNPVGGAYALALAVFVVAGLRATRTRSRLLVAAIPIVNCAFYVAAPGVKAH